MKNLHDIPKEKVENRWWETLPSPVQYWPLNDVTTPVTTYPTWTQTWNTTNLVNYTVFGNTTITYINGQRIGMVTNGTV